MLGVGIAATITPVMTHGVFYGVVGIEEDGTYSGEMNDHWGPSVITDLTVLDDYISFRKSYKNRPPILYTFDKKEEGLWIGSYDGRDSGSGIAKLIITPLNESFFQPYIV